MTIKSSSGRFLLRVFLILVAGATLMHASGTSHNQNGNAVPGVASSSSSTGSFLATWSGTFTSKNADISPFTITAVFSPDSRGRMVGNTSLVSECIKNHTHQVTL